MEKHCAHNYNLCGWFFLAGWWEINQLLKGQIIGYIPVWVTFEEGWFLESCERHMLEAERTDVRLVFMSHFATRQSHKWLVKLST